MAFPTSFVACYVAEVGQKAWPVSIARDKKKSQYGATTCTFRVPFFFRNLFETTFVVRVDPKTVLLCSLALKVHAGSDMPVKPRCSYEDF